MNRIIYLLIAGTVMAVGVAVITMGRAGARQDGQFIQVSVLAEKTANYAVDLDLPIMAPISMRLVASMVQESTNDPRSTTITIHRPPVTEPIPPSGNPPPEDNPGNPPEDDDDEEHDNDNGNSDGEDGDDRDKGKGNDKDNNNGNGDH